MPNGIMPEQRDIVLVPVPFTDLSSTKRRPVVIVSNNAYNHQMADVIVVAMTSNLSPSDYGFTVSSSDLEIGKLNRPSQIRCDKVYTLAQSVIVKVFGRVNDVTFDHVRQILQELTERKS